MRLARRSNHSDIAIAPVVASIPAVLMHRTCLWFRTATGGSRVRIWCHDSIYRAHVVLLSAFALNAAHQSLTSQGVGTMWLYLQVLWTMIQTSFQSAASSGISELPGSKILTTFQSLLSIPLIKNSGWKQPYHRRRAFFRFWRWSLRFWRRLFFCSRGLVC
jgi:hypothetical protein